MGKLDAEVVFFSDRGRRITKSGTVMRKSTMSLVGRRERQRGEQEHRQEKLRCPINRRLRLTACGKRAKVVAHHGVAARIEDEREMRQRVMCFGCFCGSRLVRAVNGIVAVSYCRCASSQSSSLTARARWILGAFYWIQPVACRLMECQHSYLCRLSLRDVTTKEARMFVCRTLWLVQRPPSETFSRHHNPFNA